MHVTRAMMIAVAAMATVCSAADLPSIGFAVKGGGHWVADPRDGDERLEPAWAIEVESPGLLGGALSVTGSFAGTHFDSHRPAPTAWSADGVDYRQRRKFQYDLYGGRLGLRWRPWRSDGWQPYVDAGGGYYQYTEETWTETTATWIDEETEEPVTEVDTTTRHKRRDHGLYPYVGAGVEIPIGEYGSLLGQTHLLIEVTHAFDDDFGGPAAVAGLRFRW